MLMAPSADHRLRFREYDKEPPLFWFSKLVLVGSTSLAAATAPAVFLVRTRSSTRAGRHPWRRSSPPGSYSCGTYAALAARAQTVKG